jgi:uncharacterized protein (TIGR02145 family)
MMEKLLKISVLVLFVILGINGCKKENGDNPTNEIPAAVFNPSVSYGTMTDQDGNVYRTVTIGTQTWMAENLRTTKYNDGTNISNVVDNEGWKNLTTGAYCTLLNVENTEIIAVFGRYYNWYAVNTGKLAPKGWHVPTDAEWIKLIDYLGGQYIASAKLKETGTNHWSASNTEATNETGFTALPGGERYISYVGNSVEFGGGAVTGCWWSTTECDTDLSWAHVMYNSDATVYRLGNYKSNGLAVRLVKD